MLEASILLDPNCCCVNDCDEALLSESGQPEVVEQANGGWVEIFCANVEERVNMFLLLQNYFSIAPVCTSIQFWHKQEECCMKA